MMVLGFYFLDLFYENIFFFVCLISTWKNVSNFS